MSILRNMLLDAAVELTATVLDDVALLVCRAGLNPFEPGEDPTMAEVQSLARARETLVKEHLVRAVYYFKYPADAFALFDGGHAKRSEMMAEAWAVCNVQ